MRTLLARQRSTGNWLQRVDTGDKAEAAFLAEVATQFGIPSSVIEVSTRDLDDIEYAVLIRDLAGGTFEGAGVVMAPLVPPPPDRDLDLADAIELAESFAAFKVIFAEYLRRKDKETKK